MISEGQDLRDLRLKTQKLSVFSRCGSNFDFQKFSDLSVQMKLTSNIQYISNNLSELTQILNLSLSD